MKWLSLTTVPLPVYNASQNIFCCQNIILVCNFWETFKLIIRGRTISYSSFKKKERDKRENDLENSLQKLQLEQENNTEELNRVVRK
jgi:hypothetical protein